MPLVQGECYRGGYSSFLFPPDQLDSRRCRLGLFVVYGYHIDFLRVSMGNWSMMGGR